MAEVNQYLGLGRRPSYKQADGLVFWGEMELPMCRPRAVVSGWPAALSACKHIAVPTTELALEATPVPKASADDRQRGHEQGGRRNDTSPPNHAGKHPKTNEASDNP